MLDYMLQDVRGFVILTAISLCVFGAVFLIILSVKPKKMLEGVDYSPLPKRGTLTRVRDDLRKKSPIYRIMLPVIGYVAFFVSKMPITGYRNRLQRNLTTAGSPGTFTPDEYIAIIVLSALSMPIFLFLVSEAVFGAWHPLLLIGGFIFGVVYPFIWLTDATTRRTKSINRSLPYTLDLLTLSIEAGLDFIAAVERIVTKKRTRGPLSEELFQMLQELKMGKTRREALRDMANRVNLENLNTVVSALIQADQLGTSLGPVLRIQSEMLRLRRSQRAEKLAMEAPVKMIFPLLFIFTSVFLLLFGPVIIKGFRGALL
ncbi:type II secretion system F family protein [bacterium]|nr:type II secretion system F family protein [candidate division CSSED10-310 bacterium]